MAIKSNKIEQGYLGNTKLKRVNTPIQWTPELIQEYAKCKDDPIYFVEKYMKIVHPDLGLIPFTLRDYQKKMIGMFCDERRVIVKLPRQSGKSVSYCGFILHYILFNSHKRVGLLANKGKTAAQILSRVQLAYENLPKWLQQGIVDYNKGSFALENGSAVIASATSSDSVRGDSYSVVILDETAFIDNWDEFYTSTYPTITSGKETKIFLVSTPKGMNHFWKIWKDAEEKKNEYKPFSINWNDVPGRDEEFKRTTIANTSEEKWRQEFETEFLGSSNTLIAGWKLGELAPETPIETNKQFGLRIFEKPKKNHRYVITVDVSQGVQQDSSCFSVIDITLSPFFQVAAFNNNAIYSHELAALLTRVGKEYNNAFILVELNDLGREVANLLKFDFDYENIIHSSSQTRRGMVLTFSSGNTLPGLKTSVATKRVGCSSLKNLIESNRLILRDEKTIDELFHFVDDGRNYSAEEGYHDDHAMTLVLFAFLANSDMFTGLHGQFTRPSEFKDDDFNAAVAFGRTDLMESKERFAGDVWEAVDGRSDFIW